MKPTLRRYSYKDHPDLEQARAAFFQGQHERSLKLFEKAAKKMPNNVMALTDAARAFGQRYEVAPALKYIKRMLHLGGNDPQVLLLAGQSLRMVFRQEGALESFQKAATLPGVGVDVFLELAVQYERCGHLEAALEAVDRCLSLNPKSSEISLLKARILRRLSEPEQAQAIYEGLASQELDPLVEAQMSNEWSHLLDSQQCYAEAFEKLLSSKQIQANTAGVSELQKHSSEEQAWLQHFTDSLTEGQMEAWSAPQADQPKSVLLTGCPRSGTTLIEKVLDAHSDVLTADEYHAFPNYILPKFLEGIRDEQGFFTASDIDTIKPSALERESKRYRRYLEDAMGEKIGKRILVDKNPSMTSLIPTTFKLSPNHQVLYALRDPRDVALSCFFRWLPLNTVSARYLSVEETAKRTAEELQTWLKLRQMMPQDRWRETRYEDTLKDHVAEGNGILKWMGVEPESGAQDYRAHLQKRGVNSPTYEAVSKPIYQHAKGRWQHYEKQLEPMMPILEKCISELGYS